MSARKIGPLKISVDYDHTDECYVGHVEADERTEACDERDAAEAAAEAKLRDMLTDLQQHFAPVLRWERRDDTFAVARLGEWRLFAHPHAWSIDLDCTPVKENEPSGAGLAENKRAAEAALRALGVVFRVEGE